ncbi:hypothetical protein BH23GEM3_BH23GEM3_00860 [soil metagenome]
MLGSTTPLPTANSSRIKLAIDRFRKVPDEQLPIEALRIAPTALRIPAELLKIRDRAGKAGSALFIEEQFRGPMNHRLEDSSATLRDHGAPCSLRLDRGNPGIFHSRKQERATPSIQVGDLLIAAAPEEFDRRAGKCLQFFPLRSVPNNNEPPFEQVSGFDRKINARVRDEPRNHEV